MATTIQQRLQYLCDLTQLSPEKLSVRAGLSRSFLRRILADPARKNIGAEAAEKLSFITKVSRSWIVSGVGAPEEPDVPRQPPPSLSLEIANDTTSPWVEIATHAMQLDPTLDWAIVGVGELPRKTATDELTAYWLLNQAERFKKTCADLNERQRLDKKARWFRKTYFAPIGHAEQPTPRRSSPPKG